MIFNGHTSDSVDALDEETIAEITVMYGDGILGGRGVYDALTPITTAMFNYIRSPNSPQYKADNIFPWIVEYQQNPDLDPDEKEKVNNALLVYMSQAPNFSMERFKNGGNSIVHNGRLP